MGLENKEHDSLDIKATLNYIKEDGVRPSIYLYDQSKHPSENYTRAAETVTIHDGRKLSTTLSNNGFELINHPTALRNEDFWSDEDGVITEQYYEEICAAVKKVTGCRYVVAFHHKLRQEAKSGNKYREKFDITSKINGYAHQIHTDSCCHTAGKLFTQFSSKFDKEVRRGKFMIINAWRNINDTAPVRDWPLTVLDCTTVVAPDDYIVNNIHFESFCVQNYLLSSANKDLHRWVYFPSMIKDEILLFTQYNSDTTAPARQTFHTAIETCPVAESKRESIEVRVLCVFPDHEPNTCPLGAAVDSPVAAYLAMMESLKAAQHWPAPAKLWMRSMIGSPMKAMEGVVKGCVEKGHNGLGGASEEFQKSVLSLLEENKDEVNRLMKGFGSQLTLSGIVGTAVGYVFNLHLVTFIVGGLAGAIIMMVM